MAKQVINTGTVPDDGTGDTLRNAFVKTNSNFDELYSNWANNSLTGISTTDLSLTVGSASGNGNLTYNDSTGAFVFTPADVPSTILDLGISDGTTGQVLTTNGSGGITFQDGGGIGLSSRTTKVGTTSSLADDASADLNITNAFKGYALLAIETDRAAWIRVYTHASARSADASRTQATDPDPGSGVIAEVITTGAGIVQISPGTIGYSFEGTPGTTIPCRVTNLSGSTATVEVTLTVIQLEA
jgi:hypothetical protein